MKFELNHIIPYPLKNQIAKESIWNKSFTINSTKNYLVSAQSGKGKSTLVAILYGIRNDYEGNLKINDKDVNAYSLNELSSLRTNNLSIVFQDLKLFGERSLIENLLVKNDLTNYKTTKEIYNLIEEFGLKGKENQLCKTLSYGQQQRTAIIRALLQPFDFILLDEPFSHLDDDNASIAIEVILEECNKQNAGFLITSLGNTHSLRDFQMISI